jgi:putative PEP-CTERM system histidine kinase
MAIGCYLVAMVILARLFDFAGGSFAPVAQILVVIAMSAGALPLLVSRRARAWLKVKVIKHFFQHRYDYRVEWIRFTETLGRPGEDAAPLEQRVIQAVADITESPGGVLLLPDGQDGLYAAARWNWPAGDLPAEAGDARLARHFGTGRIVEFDALRRADPATDHEAALIPAWIMMATVVWAAVPLLHNERLVGAVLLARPEIGREFDWEDFDLLRIVGRQVASYLAEAQSQEALSEARRFDEFNRRFAFIMHDIKNLVSQLSLVARNAERHADNPEFRADMVATLRSSVDKMNGLLARLSQHNKGRAGERRPVALGALLDQVAAAKRPRHPVSVERDGDLVAVADPGRLDQALNHLVQNAIEASPKDAPVVLRLSRHGETAVVEVIDRGTGMSAEFIRAKLFRPFTSTKDGGFGVGAFEARELVGAMGGRLEIESREAEGSRFSVILPLAAATTQPVRQAEGTDA